MKKAKKWVSRITSITVYGMLLVMVVLVVSSKLSGGSPKIFGHELLTVLSGSMEPGIKTGSIISVTPVKSKETLKKGDIITFRAPDAPSQYITHRIIEVKKINSSVQYMTKGDNNDSKDSSPVPAENVVAQYDHFTIPYVGYIFSFLKSKAGAILTLIIPGVLMVVWSILSILKTIQSIDQEKTDANSIKMG